MLKSSHCALSQYNPTPLKTTSFASIYNIKQAIENDKQISFYKKYDPASNQFAAHPNLFTRTHTNTSTKFKEEVGGYTKADELEKLEEIKEIKLEETKARRKEGDLRFNTIKSEQLVKMMEKVVTKINKWINNEKKKGKGIKRNILMQAIISIMREIPAKIQRILLNKNQIRRNSVEEQRKATKICFKEGFLKLVCEGKNLEMEEERILYTEFLSMCLSQGRISQIIENESKESAKQNNFSEGTLIESEVFEKAKMNKAFILIYKKIISLSDACKIQKISYSLEILNKMFKE